MSIERVAVIGCGQMGLGITEVCAGAYNSMGNTVRIFAIGVAQGKPGYEIAERTELPPDRAEECAMSLT